MSDVASPHPAPPHAHLPIDLRWWKQAAGAVIAVPVALYLAYGTTLCAWRGMVAQPAPTHITLANGVEYTRSTQSDPNHVWHIVKVDLSAEGLEVQGPEVDATLALPLRAMPATEAVAKNHWVLAFGAGASLAANAGEPTAPEFGVSSRGVAVPAKGDEAGNPVLQFQLGMPAVLAPTFKGSSATTSVVADGWLLREGNAVKPCYVGEPTCSNGHDGVLWETRAPQARLGIGLDAAGKTMYIAMIDGRLAKSSQGATAQELAIKLKSLGAVNAAQFAHGDAVGMAAVLPGTTEGTVVGTPVAGGVPGREPALGFVLGLKAAPRL